MRETSHGASRVCRIPLMRRGTLQFVAASASQLTVAPHPDFNAPTGTIMFWMKSAGIPRAYGLMAAPVMSRRFSGTISGPPSIGLPPPERIRPSISLPTGILMVSPVKRIPLSLPIPVVVSKTWTTTSSSLVSST